MAREDIAVDVASVPPRQSANPVILVVDHYDSFTYNLVQLIESLGREVEVVRSDSQPVAALVERSPDAVVLSPGPGRPETAGCFLDLLAALDRSTPVLGVCLGHQALGVSAGGAVDRAEPVHGKAGPVYHDGDGIFEGVPSPFEAGRYHSLVLTRESLPADVALTAWTREGVVMGTQHRELPRFGVQFHPESILTPHGPAIVRNFLALAGA
ncbi:MAG TPA: aminodeoxychorismate/anthranilate synthase component II [Actinomycetota bacterium]